MLPTDGLQGFEFGLMGKEVLCALHPALLLWGSVKVATQYCTRLVAPESRQGRITAGLGNNP